MPEREFLETFSAMFTDKQIHFGKCQNKSGAILGTFPVSPASL
jgi:hypothetical protein